MTIAQGTAVTTWEGSLAAGRGSIDGRSGALHDLDVTWAARTEEPEVRTSPEELAAAAHRAASRWRCRYSWAKLTWARNGCRWKPPSLWTGSTGYPRSCPPS